MVTSSDWFIASRVRRLLPVLVDIPARAPGITIEAHVEALRATVSGPRDELPDHIDVLVGVGLVRVDDENRVTLTADGKRAVSMRADRANLFIAQRVIQYGLLHDQVRRLIEASTIRSDGSAFIRVGLLRKLAPQLSGLLQLWPGVVGKHFVDVPPEVFADIDTPWSLIPLPRIDDGRRKAVGNRAEAYSYQYLRLGGSRPPLLTWVALDDDNLGYDIEDRSPGIPQRIEVKASQQPAVRFFLSENEHRVAHVHPPSYIVHFWGDINLNRDPNSEFALLVSRGFPIVYSDLANHLADGRLKATAVKYRVVPGTVT